MDDLRANFKSIWLVNFEFIADDGNNPAVVCLVAHELHSGLVLSLSRDDIDLLVNSPYDVTEEALFVSYCASDVLRCHIALGWDMPSNVLDLYVEFRNETNGLPLPCGTGLIGALTWYGLDSLVCREKPSVQNLIHTGGPWSDAEIRAIFDYCESEVFALEQLLPKIAVKLDLPRALLRGSYMKAVAQMEFHGVPIDTKKLNQLKDHWETIKEELIERIDLQYNVYQGTTFKQEQFSDYLIENDIPWPRLPSGQLDLSDDTFKAMAKSYPKLAPLRELRTALSQMRLGKLAVGLDGRNRCHLSPYRARTGRNQPSTNKFIFGPSVWIRGLIKPSEGYGLAYIDWCQQEFGIAAALSGDPKMQDAYQSGDPYLAFAKQAGAVPQGATKATHKAEREQFKACVLAVQYGMGAEALAQNINQPTFRAKELLRLHRETYKVFWRWCEGTVDHAMLHGKLWTTFGWTVHVDQDPNPRFLQNFPMQANGAEMLRLACNQLIEAGISVCAPIHDAVLIEAPLSVLDATIELAQQIMSDASAVILDGFRLNTDVDVTRYPERYSDERGVEMWESVMRLLEPLEEKCNA
jgi:hypothetical protein